MMKWYQLHPSASIEMLGFIPSFLDENDPRPAREQFNTNYVSGWCPFKGHIMNPTNRAIEYPGDPPLLPLAMTHLRDETIIVYNYAWVAILQPDETYEIARMD